MCSQRAQAPGGGTDPDRALHAFRWGMMIAQDSGNRYYQSNLASVLARREAVHGDTSSAFDQPHSGDPQLPQVG